MRARSLVVVLLVVVGLCGCKERKNAVLILNEQWSVNQAMADCQTRARQEGPTCTTDPGLKSGILMPSWRMRSKRNRLAAADAAHAKRFGPSATFELPT